MSETDSNTDKEETCYRCGGPASLRAAGSDNVFRPFCRECFERGDDENTENLWLLIGALLVAVLGAVLGEFVGALLLLTVVYLVGAMASWWTFFGVSVSMRP